MMTCSAVKSYSFKINNDGSLGTGYTMSDDGTVVKQNVSMEVDERVRKHMQDNGEDDYRKALHKVLEGDPELAKRYSGM